MLNYFDNTITDLEFFSIFIVILIAAHVASWAFDRWIGGRR